MEFLSQIWEWLLAQGGVRGIAVMAALLAAFAVQLWYYMRAYGRIPSHRNGDGEAAGGISVIVPLRAVDYKFLEETLPLILAQDIGRFEVVLMDMADDADFSYTLSVAAEREARLHIMKLTGVPMRRMSDKMALNVGIKGAKYENLVFTTAACRPVSDKWLAGMARGFTNGSVVIGYCGLECGSSGGAWGRLERVAWSARWLGNALRGRPYRGTVCNMGFTKAAYYDNDGFNYLNINIGEDDLFVQKLARKNKVSVVTAGKAAVRQKLWGGWYRQKKLSSATFRFYPAGVKFYIGAELWSRAVFFAAAAWLIITMPFYVQVAAAGLALARLIVVWIEMWRVSRRLLESGLMWFLPVFDLLTPLLEAWLAVSRSIIKPQGLWR